MLFINQRRQGGCEEGTNNSVLGTVEDYLKFYLHPEIP